MTLITRLSYFLIAVTCSFMSASIFLLNQYKQGIPYPFATSVTLAALVGLVAPLLAVVFFVMLVKKSDARHRYFVFCGVCLSLSALISFVTF